MEVGWCLSVGFECGLYWCLVAASVVVVCSWEDCVADDVSYFCSETGVWTEVGSGYSGSEAAAAYSVLEWSAAAAGALAVDESSAGAYVSTSWSSEAYGEVVWC